MFITEVVSLYGYYLRLRALLTIPPYCSPPPYCSLLAQRLPRGVNNRGGPREGGEAGLEKLAGWQGGGEYRPLSKALLRLTPYIISSPRAVPHTREKVKLGPEPM